MGFEKVVPSSGPYYSNIGFRKDEKELLRQCQISKMEVKLKERLEQMGIWVVLNFHLKTPDEDNQSLIKDRYVDLYLPKKDLAIEIDGQPFHESNKQKKRDHNKNKAIQATGITHILRLEFSIPDKLIYGKIRDRKHREIVKAKYQKFEERWLEKSVKVVMEYDDVESLNTSYLLLE